MALTGEKCNFHGTALRMVLDHAQVWALANQPGVTGFRGSSIVVTIFPFYRAQNARTQFVSAKLLARAGSGS